MADEDELLRDDQARQAEIAKANEAFKRELLVKWHLDHAGGYFVEKASPKVAEYWARIERWLCG